jgi:hypothetical protein
MVENAGMKLRLLDTKAIDRFPSNGLIDEINRFDAAKVAAEAKAWKPGR